GHGQPSTALALPRTSQVPSAAGASGKNTTSIPGAPENEMATCTSGLRLLPAPVFAEIVVHRGIAPEMPDDALSVPLLVEDSVQETENLPPRRLGLSGAVATRHGVVQEAVGRLSIDADVKTLPGGGQHVAHAQHVV